MNGWQAIAAAGVGGAVRTPKGHEMALAHNSMFGEESVWNDGWEIVRVGPEKLEPPKAKSYKTPFRVWEHGVCDKEGESVCSFAYEKLYRPSCDRFNATWKEAHERGKEEGHAVALRGMAATAPVEQPYAVSSQPVDSQPGFTDEEIDAEIVEWESFRLHYLSRPHGFENEWEIVRHRTKKAIAALRELRAAKERIGKLELALMLARRDGGMTPSVVQAIRAIVESGRVET